jgi:hypothetical protein
VFKLGIEPVKVELIKLYVELVVKVEYSVLLGNACVVDDVAFYQKQNIKYRISLQFQSSLFSSRRFSVAKFKKKYMTHANIFIS